MNRPSSPDPGLSLAAASALASLADDTHDTDAFIAEVDAQRPAIDAMLMALADDTPQALAEYAHWVETGELPERLRPLVRAAVVAAEAIACDAWVAVSGGQAFGYERYGDADSEATIGRARMSFRAGDRIMPDEVYWPDPDPRVPAHEAGDDR